jgi:guanine deaminase
MQQEFMRRAIAIAEQSFDEPGTLPFGAVVVREGEIIGEGLNRSTAGSDPTSHGEVEAIRDACRRLGVTTLPGADLYTNCAPCPMCLATMYLAGIETLYYAAGPEDGADLFRRLIAADEKWARPISAAELRQEVALPSEERRMPSQQILADEARRVFDAFVARHVTVNDD